jgi:spermidine synthase
VSPKGSAVSSDGAAKKSPLLLAGGFLGASAALSQILVIRESLTVFSGNEITLSIILALWFLGICIGSRAAGFVFAFRSAQTIASRNASSLVGISILLMGPVAVLALLLSRWARALLSIPLGTIPTFMKVVAGTALTAIPVSFVIGFAFPALAAMVRGSREKGATALAYTAEGAGAALAGITYTFILAGNVTNGAIAMGIWAAGMMIWGLYLGRGASSLIAMTLSLSILLQAPSLDSATAQLRWNTICPDLPLVENIDTRYQNIALTKQAELYSIYCDGVYTFSFPDPYVVAEDAFMALVQHPEPTRILLVGDGTGALAAPILALTKLNASVTAVPFDPGVSDMLRRHTPAGYLPSEKSEKFRSVAGDGRTFIKNSRQTFDLVILNLPESSSIMTNRYHTREFFREVKTRLAPGGTLATSVSSSSNYLSAEGAIYLAQEIATLKAVFAHVTVIPGQKARVFASDSPASIITSPLEMISRYSALGSFTSTFDPEMFHVLVEEDRVIARQEELERYVEKASLNTDDWPSAFISHLRFWEKMATGTGSDQGGALFLRGLRQIWPWIMGIPAVLLFLMAVRFLSLPANNSNHSDSADPLNTESANTANTVNTVNTVNRASTESANTVPMRGTALKWGVLTTGFTAMATQTALLAIFQTVYGYLYSSIGAINGIFMAGLILGGYMASRSGGRLFMLSETLAMATPLGAWLLAALFLTGDTTFWLSMGVMGYLAFGFATFLAGWATGLSLPSAAAEMVFQTTSDGPDRDVGSHEGEAAASLNFHDHVGAMAGAALMGLCIIPVMGFKAGLVAVALLKGASLACNGAASLAIFIRRNRT